jgi:hypothetical protein
MLITLKKKNFEQTFVTNKNVFTTLTIGVNVRVLLLVVSLAK